LPCGCSVGVRLTVNFGGVGPWPAAKFERWRCRAACRTMNSNCLVVVWLGGVTNHSRKVRAFSCLLAAAAAFFTSASGASSSAASPGSPSSRKQTVPSSLICLPVITPVLLHPGGGVGHAPYDEGVVAGVTVGDSAQTGR